MSLMVGPERYSAPPVETWMIPSLPASANPASAAFNVCEEDTLIAGNANDFAFAVSSISAYFSGVAIGMPPTLDDQVHPLGVTDHGRITPTPLPRRTHHGA